MQSLQPIVTLPDGLGGRKGLLRGTYDMPERRGLNIASWPVVPVPRRHIDAALPLVSAQVGATIRLRMLIGMRPREAYRRRFIDIDTTESEWLYEPPRHETAWRGKARLVPFGPRAREALGPG
jgi:hypothetical protein